LELGDSRAVFKNVSIDINSKTENVLHAESLQNETVLRDDQMVGFIRFEMICKISTKSKFL
jgi:hypothetical protein